jgi:hypothetical protein
MLRASILVLVGLVAAGVLLDPYTLHYDASDFVRPGPWWQRMLGLVDLGLLAAALLMVWRRRHARARVLLAAETVWAIGSALILVHRDGSGRFAVGFGAEPYLTGYLVLTGLRCAALGLLWFAARQAERRAAAAH